MVAQAHGGALKRGNPGNTGHKVAAERRRARVERTEAINDAMAGYAEKFLGLVGQMLEQLGGEQYRCACGLYGPKVLKATLREVADVAVKFAEAAKDKGEAATVIPIQVNVYSHAPLVAGKP